MFVRYACSILFYLAVCGAPWPAAAAELPKTLQSAPCSAAPTLDGKIGEDEWQDVPLHEFDMPVLNVKTQKLTHRRCQWRAMNSANALYIACTVLDTTHNKSLEPLNFDLATLAFCRGTTLAANDDRKVVGPGIYRDKHFVAVGKDADDARQDGQAVMLHRPVTGNYSIEFGFPLSSGDKQDLQTEAGGKLRFNFAYLDGFQLDLEGTEIGSVYPGGLDQAGEWGTLELAANVTHDGDAAFKGPAWIQKSLDSVTSPAVRRWKITDTQLVQAPTGSAARVLIEYPCRSPQGQQITCQAKLYLPVDDSQFKSQVPLLYSAGYELDENSALAHVSRGYAVATPRAVEPNPLVRTVNPDTTLLHSVRALPWIDDAKVVVTGGSAGGYATLMTIAETFPVAAAAPAVPPVNLGYNTAYILQRESGNRTKFPDAPQTPVFDVIVPIGRGAQGVYGKDFGSESYFRHSPTAQIDTITCPVSVYWTTADMLVPIDQVGSKWVRPFDATQFPPEFTFDPGRLAPGPLGQAQFIDRLQPESYNLVVISEADIKEYLARLPETRRPVELPYSREKQWSIVILDEGSPEPAVGHTKHAVPWSPLEFFQRTLERPLAVQQLTPAKLARLMERYAGREWLPTQLVHLDAPAVEQEDVIRGLRTYARTSPKHAEQLLSLYRSLPPEQHVLPAEILDELTSSSTPQ